MKILIIADGIIAKHFLDRIIQTGSSYHFDVVYYDNSLVPAKKPDNFTFLKFDPTSFSKLSLVLAYRYTQIMIALSNKTDTIASYENIRKIQEDTYIFLLDRWNLAFEDKNIFLFNLNQTTANRFADYLPDIPVFAQNVGLGMGEIMEVKVPVGSAYVYQQVSTVEQQNWRISAIYRENQLILPYSKLTIQANDILLLAGNPDVLKNVYKSIKRELGQFPLPFGKNLYCFMDMSVMDSAEVKRLSDEALVLHAKLNNKKLYFRVINPSDLEMLSRLKSYASAYIEILIEYQDTNLERLLIDDVNTCNVGLIVSTNDIFNQKRYRKIFYHTKVAIFKIAKKGVMSISKTAILAYDGMKKDNISSIVFDASTQLDTQMLIYDFDPDNAHVNADLVDHYKNLAKLYEKKLDVIHLENNPIIALEQENDVLYVFKFTRSVVNSGFFSIFTKDFEKLHYKFNHSNQLFIPSL